jgi:lactoylglutathione lyase
VLVRIGFGTLVYDVVVPCDAPYALTVPYPGLYQKGSLAMSDHFTLHHVSLYVRDADASASFYANVLGLQEIPNRVGKSRWFTIDGFRTFHLIGGDPEPERPREFSTHVALATGNFEAALARLEQHGVTYESLARQPKDITIRADGVRQVYFQDPDGHWIEINDANAEP